MTKKVKFLMFPVVGFLAGCATTGEEAPAKPIPPLRGPAVQQVAGPYEQAKACVSRITEVASIRVGVYAINDLTGKVNIQADGTGSFVTQGATDMTVTALSNMGVQAVELSDAYKQTVDWFINKGSKGTVKQPQFIVLGSVDALDFGTYGQVAEASVYGVGPKLRAYRATGRMDLRLVTMPYGKTTGGAIQASSAFSKEFIAVENGIGGASFVGGGSGLTFASFNIGSNKREPMQATIGYMADYGAVDLILKLLDKLDLAKVAVANCKTMLEDPYGTSGKNIQLASVN